MAHSEQRLKTIKTLARAQERIANLQSAIEKSMKGKGSQEGESK